MLTVCCFEKFNKQYKLILILGFKLDIFNNVLNKDGHSDQVDTNCIRPKIYYSFNSVCVEALNLFGSKFKTDWILFQSGSNSNQLVNPTGLTNKLKKNPEGFLYVGKSLIVHNHTTQILKVFFFFSKSIKSFYANNLRGFQIINQGC